MNAQHHPGDKRDASSPARNNPLPWFLGIVAVAGGAWLLLDAVDGLDSGTSLVAVAWGLLVLTFGAGAAARWSRRRTADGRRAPAAEDIHRLVDTDALRAVRDGRGRTTAVRELRDQVPSLSLSAAVKFIDGL